MTWKGERKSRLPKEWRKIRLYILERDNRVCYICGMPGADQVDHMIAGDNHSETNLAAIHDDPCHRLKSAREGHAARPKKTRPREQHPGYL